jgi:hypothetical protein
MNHSKFSLALEAFAIRGDRKPVLSLTPSEIPPKFYPTVIRLRAWPLIEPSVRFTETRRIMEHLATVGACRQAA